MPQPDHAAYPAISKNGTVMNSPLLFEMLQAYDPERYHEILDTGAASSSSIEYFSQYRCKLYITDSIVSLCKLETEIPDVNEELEQALSEAIALDSSKGIRLDVLLLWDLPNYLSADVLKRLVSCLLPCTRKGSVLHTYIHTSRFMPDRPSRYHLLNEVQVRTENDSIQSQSSPMLYQQTLNSILQPFKIKRSILLANGIQEYLLVRA